MRVIDNTNVPELLQRINLLSNKAMQVGIFGSDDSEVLLYASVHEFGSPKIKIPERSFIRATFDEKESEINKTVERFMIRYIEGDISIRTLESTLGEYLVGLVKKTIVDMDSPSLQPETIARKGSSGVLIDTGRMLDTVTYKMVEV